MNRFEKLVHCVEDGRERGSACNSVWYTHSKGRQYVVDYDESGEAVRVQRCGQRRIVHWRPQ